MKMKKSYGYARLQQVLEPSPYRVTPRCSFCRQCGGCQLLSGKRQGDPIDYQKAKQVYGVEVVAPAIADAYFRYDGKRRTALPLEETPYAKNG